jgi:hypothetical protein
MAVGLLFCEKKSTQTTGAAENWIEYFSLFFAQLVALVLRLAVRLVSHYIHGEILLRVVSETRRAK